MNCRGKQAKGKLDYHGRWSNWWCNSDLKNDLFESSGTWKLVQKKISEEKFQCIVNADSLIRIYVSTPKMTTLKDSSHSDV